MDAVTEVCDLEVGVVVAGVAHTRVVLRRARLADAYAAAAAVDIPEDIGTNRLQSVAYQLAVDDAEVLSQIEQLGNLDPLPSIQSLVAEIDPDDMALLRGAAARLKKKLRLSKSGSLPIDVPSSSSSEPVSA